MSPGTHSPHRRSWLVPQFSLGTLFWLMLVAGIAAVWWRDRASLEQRLVKLEQLYGPTPQPLWGAKDILGPPDDKTGSAGKSWCPRSANATDWIEVRFDQPVAAATIDIYETYSIGCVTEVVAIDSQGGQTTIWKGTDPTVATAQTGTFRLPVPASVKSVERVKIHIDSTGTSSWACIDAVGLTTAAGKTTWATSSTASSAYGGSALSASLEPTPWYSFW